MRAIHHFPYHILSPHREDMCGLPSDASSISLKDRKYSTKFVDSSDLVFSCTHSLFQGNVWDVAFLKEYSKCYFNWHLWPVHAHKL